MRGKRSAAAVRGIRPNLPTILLLVLVILFLFMARIIYSPLLLSIEESLGLGHAQAASFFLFITIGYSGMMIFSGFVAAAVGHRTTIVLSALVAAAGLFTVSFSSSLWGMRAALILLGVGAGLYFPSGIPTITALVDERDEGKALALHEIGPNLSFVLVPIGAVFALRYMSWRRVLFLLSCVGFATGILFLAFARGGTFRGKPPHLPNAKLVLGRSSFWIMAALFAVGAGAGSGVFAMTPTFLVSERSMDPELVNSLIGLSRLSGLAAIFVAGYLVDRFGARRIITTSLLSAGIATAALSAAYRPVLITAVFLQPILIACFFPAGYRVVSQIAPRDMHNLTISFMFPIGYAVGAGLVPLFLGFLGDQVSFAFGFLLYGALLAACALLPAWLRLDSGSREPVKRAKKIR